MKINIYDEAYNMSSELFSFKEMRRGVVEHGKTCYIEGYKKHHELFCNFLIKNGYFSTQEINKIICEFDSYLNESPAISISVAEDCLYIVGKAKGISKDAYLYDFQKDIVEEYKNLTNDKYILQILKPRQKGVTTILEDIAYIESNNGKKVLYFTYDLIKGLFNKNVTLKTANIENVSEKSIVNSRYDLIIFDEIILLKNPLKTISILSKCLNENGRIILSSCVPLRTKENYNNIKELFVGEHNFKNKTIGYVVKPTKEQLEKAQKCHEFENEFTVEFPKE